jgi:CubicO group peptidase (beta-lactamase class C family)
LLSLAGRSLEDILTASDALALIARQEELNFAPGTEYLYSNSNYVLLTEIIRRSTGKSLREYAAEKIFQPLGMKDTHFHDDRRHVVPRRVFSYDMGPDGSWRTNYLMNLEMVGDGGLYSTVSDLVRWDAAFYEDLLGVPDFAARMYTRGVLSTGDTIYYAGGLGVGIRRGLPRVTHAGGLMAFRTMTARYPDQHTTVITLCNAGEADAGMLTSSVEDVVLEGEFLNAPESSASSTPAPQAEGAERPVPASAASELIGTYRSGELTATLELELEEGQLRVRAPSGNSFPLTMRGEVMVTPQGLTLEPIQGGNGVTGFLLSAPRARNIRFRRLPEG